MLLRDERTLRFVGNGHTEVELAVVVLGREDEVILAVFLNNVAVPHLFLYPCHLILVENDAVVGNFAGLNIVERQHMIVAHLEVAAVIVEHVLALTVMTGVDVQAVVKHVGCRVGHIVAGE